ncbi:MAG: biotin--[acetyl-CoA-carboxylase] ligase [Omnitrophica WOR_2 bacterium RBG_13_41_10]|nr:MAG: biotin--[acetyl-CoA-carboxylase] ligase [Omnitrophica WOR_2 bacterium RBG_13_41_10]
MLEEKILEFLKRKPNYVSGDQISHSLGVSRQALWKHIQELRDTGYHIVAVPHLGYKLVSSPDRLFPLEISQHLNSKFMGKKIYYFDAVSSTMDIATGLGIKGSPEGTIVVAETQTKGRGRMARCWFSPKYKGIYLSIILRPDILPNSTPLLTLLCAVSILEAIKSQIGLDTKIKWPNDLLIHNKKVGGILTELNAEMDITHFVVIGIGLNVNNDKKSLVEGATSLKEEAKEEVGRLSLIQDILRSIETNYIIFQQKGGQHIIEKWRLNSATLGKRIKVNYQKTHLEGQAIDIDTDGGLLVRCDSGLIEKIMAADIVHCR